jgi:N-methylhydantoinase A
VDKLTPQKRLATGRKVEKAVKSRRSVDFIEAGVHEATIYDGDALEPGMSLVGPAIIEEAGTTIVIQPGLPCRVDDYGNYLIETAQ